jgi:predicted DsbA family dithiol-disulfide isomerase
LAELRAKYPVEIEWLAYELRPEPVPLPDFSTEAREHFLRGWERGVKPMAERYGMEMNFPSVKTRTRRAHAAALYARDRGKGEEMRVALFRAYFVHDRDLNDLDVLAEIGASVGLDANDLRASIERDEYTEDVIAQEQLAAQLGITAVPTIIIGEVGVQGAQPFHVLERVYEEAKRRAATTPAADGDGAAM